MAYTLLPNQDKVGLTNLWLNPTSGEEWDILIVDSVTKEPIFWKGVLSTEPQNPSDYWVYVNTTDSIKYRWLSGSWEPYNGVGQIPTISDQEYIPQKVKQLLLTGLGEVQTDVEYGVPWLDEILGVKNPDLGVISSILTDILEEDEVLISLGVTDVDINDMELNSTNGNLTIGNLVITISDGSSVTIGGVTI